MTLSFHFLNVGHGSSVVVEYDGPHGKVFGVIDSQASVNAVPAALQKLQLLAAPRLSFICLTHPHADHYSGMFKIIQAYHGKIDTFVSFSIGELLRHSTALKALAKTYRKINATTDDIRIKAGSYELCKILEWAHGLGDAWLPTDGLANQLALDGFMGVSISNIQPPKGAKGAVLQSILNEDPRIAGTYQANELSLALEFSYAGRKIIIGGDATADNWFWRSMRHEKKLSESIDADVVNIPHHGSVHDCTPEVLHQLFDTKLEPRRKIAVTSGDGAHHPHPDTIKWLEREGVEPFCTGLLPMCGANASSLLPLPGLDPLIARWAREVSDNATYPQPCQGSITITITPDGGMSVSPEFNAPCAFRGDYERLFV